MFFFSFVTPVCTCNFFNGTLFHGILLKRLFGPKRNAFSRNPWLSKILSHQIPFCLTSFSPYPIICSSVSFSAMLPFYNSSAQRVWDTSILLRKKQVPGNMKGVWELNEASTRLWIRHAGRLVPLKKNPENKHLEEEEKKEKV